MQDGYWINFKTDKSIRMHDHEIFMRNIVNAKKMGVSESVHVMAAKIKTREAYLTFIMRNAPLIRVRGHGSFVTFEYNTRARRPVMDAIWSWGMSNAGPFTVMNISNLATRENTQMSYRDFEKAINEGGADAVMRVATVSKIGAPTRQAAMELLIIAKEISDNF